MTLFRKLWRLIPKTYDQRLQYQLLHYHHQKGGSKTPDVPQPPDIGEATRESIEAQIEALPAIYGAQMEYGPKLLEQDIEAMRKYAPEMAELYTGLQEQYRERLSPGWYELYKGVSGRAGEGLGLGGEIPPELREKYQEEIRAAQSARGTAYSPISASGEASALAGLSEQTRQQRMAQAAAVLGIAMPTGVPVQQTGMPSPISTPNTQSMIGNIYQGYGSYAPAYAQASEAGSQGFGFGDIFGGMVDLGVGAMGAGLLGGGGNAMLLPAMAGLMSDKNAKENFEEVDSKDVLKLLAKLKVSKWNYKGDNKRHIGPMAQDFKKLFAVGTDDKHIDVIDAIGVLIAAVQQLEKRAVN